MVLVTVKRAGQAGRVFDVATTAELLEKVDKSRHFPPGGTLEDWKGVVLGSTYLLKEGAEFDWFPPAQGSTGASAGTKIPVEIARNLADLTPEFRPDPEGTFEGMNLHRVNKHLFVENDVVEQLHVWLSVVEHRLKGPWRDIGPPPLFVNGLVKTGKTFVLTQVLPAVLANSPVFGVGRPDEARVIKLDLVGLPVKQGFQAMLQAMLEDVVMQMLKLGFASLELTLAVDALAKPEAERHVSATMLWHLFEDPQVPVLLLIDEIQNLLLPRAPESGHIDTNTQYTAMLLLKQLVTSPCPKLLVAATGSSMASFMLQVGEIPPNGTAVLSHSFLLDLPPKHGPLVLQKVLDDEVSFLATPQSPALSKEERQELLAASESAAFMMQALYDFSYMRARLSMYMFLIEFIGGKMMHESLNEWGGVLREFTDADRRAFLGLALTYEGLNLYNVRSISLQSMLHKLTVPIKPGSPLKVFETSYHRNALQVLIGADGSMRKLSAIPSGDVHIGWLDACLHLLAAGNSVRAWSDAKQFERAVELLQEPAELLVKECRCAAEGWHKQDWFKEVLYHGANQGAKGTGPKVDSLEAVSPKGAAGRYKAALELQLQSNGSLSAGEHLAHYLILLRNVVAHMASAVTWGEDAAGSGSVPAAADVGSEGSEGEEGSAVEEPFVKDPVETFENLVSVGRALSCAEILAASPAAQPFAQVVTRYHSILTSMPPLPPAREPTKQGKAGGSGTACLPGGASGGSVFRQQGRGLASGSVFGGGGLASGSVFRQQGRGLASGSVFGGGGLASGSVLLGGLRRTAGPQPSVTMVVASPLRPARSSGNSISSKGAAAQPRAVLRRVVPISSCMLRGTAGGVRGLAVMSAGRLLCRLGGVRGL